ncbi:MAG TPA: cupin domain-containing protein [Burkholderiales bacterium]|nr:cupin domain-containing protein [Burkholderiales bacterium]
MQLRLLGGLAPRTFLVRHWQKRPLFVRNALARVPDMIDERALCALAMRDDVESRIVERRGGRWETAHGPFANVSVKRRNWTILVSGLNLHLRAADALLRPFRFIPQARLDDVMASFATPGGGVGPHVDSYDVFLLQGPGRRRWRVAGVDYLAGPGDLLYVPPGLRHDGVALERCFTYSIGFRAPRGAELGAAFLDWLHERGLPDSTYRDPWLAPSRSPGALPPDMITFAEKAFARISWSRADVATFLGEYLTMPKAHVVFRPGRARARRLVRSMVRLDPKSQLLYHGARFFMNGETMALPARAASALRRLADRRAAAGASLAAGPLPALLSSWRRAGWIHLDKL